MRDAPACPRLAHAPIQFDGLGEIGHRAGAVARLITRYAAVEISLGVARVNFDDDAEIAYCGGEVALLEEDDPAIKQGVEEARGDLKRLVVIAPRAVEVSFAVTGEAAAVPGGGDLLISGDGETEVGDGAFELALFQPGASAFYVRLG